MLSFLKFIFHPNINSIHIIMQAFHVFHISCLIHWVLLCDSEVYTKELVCPQVKKRYRRKKGARLKKVEEEARKQIYCSFCPECQGTGVDIDGDELEKPTVSLSEVSVIAPFSCFESLLCGIKKRTCI